MRHVTTKDQSDYMAVRKVQNKRQFSAAEDWAWQRIRQCGVKISRQAQWSCRLFDFWCADKGVAIEIDGPEHDADYDAHRDRYNYVRSAIVVLRVRNFDAAGLQRAIDLLLGECSWSERRVRVAEEFGGLGCDFKKGGAAKRRVSVAGLTMAHGKWKPKEINSQ